MIEEIKIDFQKKTRKVTIFFVSNHIFHPLIDLLITEKRRNFVSLKTTYKTMTQRTYQSLRRLARLQTIIHERTK